MVSLTEEIHGLMRVMWSGKWAVVTPHTVLSAIWTHIPSFRGYCQQDAQEFLWYCLLLVVYCLLCSQLLDQLQNELLKCPSGLIIKINNPWRDTVLARDLLKSLFEGQLISTIVYSNCGHTSFVCESFWDLSLELAITTLQNTSSRRSLSNSSTLFDSLNKFTATEHIDDNIFECSRCQGQHQSIKKQLLIKDPPEVLRIHLKRFRFINNCWRKLTNQIEFPMELNMYRYCNHDNQSVGVVNGEEDTVYDLSSVIVHHGNYSNTGHYTAYCWNNDAGCWVHCNDAKLNRSSSEEVLKSQPYVLFYARRRGRSPVLNRLVNDGDESGPDTKHMRTENI
uniref:ubiquitinyl hydrolase 1 n=1 Tax=Amphimedon queenslandica TaxID=400682 RepID=A0A1X7UZS1_AMPQE